MLISEYFSNNSGIDILEEVLPTIIRLSLKRVVLRGDDKRQKRRKELPSPLF
jgi:hypothetical protein